MNLSIRLKFQLICVWNWFTAIFLVLLTIISVASQGKITHTHWTIKLNCRHISKQPQKFQSDIFSSIRIDPLHSSPVFIILTEITLWFVDFLLFLPLSRSRWLDITIFYWFFFSNMKCSFKTHSNLYFDFEKWNQLNYNSNVCCDGKTIDKPNKNGFGKLSLRRIIIPEQ